MPAQSGDSIVLAYGAQGAQQSGTAIILDYAGASGVSLRLVAGTRAAWSASERNDVIERAVIAPAQDAAVRLAVQWRGTAALDESDTSTWMPAQSASHAADAPWNRFTGRGVSRYGSKWAVSAAADRGADAPWGRFTGRGSRESIAPWALSARIDERAGMPWGGPMLVLQPGVLAQFPRGVPADRIEIATWTRFSQQLTPSWGIVIPVHDPEQGPEALYVVPVKRVYMVLNTATLRRVDTNTQLPALGFNLKLDSGSWTWGFDATLPASAQSLVESSDGTPVELEAMVNGTPFRFIVEGISRNRAFKVAAITITGRGKASAFDKPYANIMSFNNADTRTAQQLAGDALAATEYGATWALNWGLTDWLVPAGVWSFTGTQIGALGAIAAAAGGYVQPHASDLSLSILPQYPIAPWDWGTVAPDYELPSDVVTREGIDWTTKPFYDRIFVSGAQQGILGQVTRAGAAGDHVAQMVTDALITEAAAARQRGIAELALARGLDTDPRRIATMTLRLPVLAETGVIPPGKFVRYVDGGVQYIGITRSVAVDVAMPGIWQTIGVETHVN